jgi:hypothetical protein
MGMRGEINLDRGEQEQLNTKVESHSKQYKRNRQYGAVPER